MIYFVIVALLIATTVPAHAYIDPASGSYVLQMAMAGLMAVVFSIKLCWQRIKLFVAKGSKKQSPTDTPPDNG